MGCVFWAEDKIWTSVQHNNTELTRVRGASPEKPYSMALDYGGSLEQLEAVIDNSEHCEQEVAYHCRRSRLLNTPGKAHPCSYSAWATKGNHTVTRVPQPGVLKSWVCAHKGTAAIVVHYAVKRNTARRTSDGLVVALIHRV